MKKIILLILLAIGFFSAKAQFPINTPTIHVRDSASSYTNNTNLVLQGQGTGIVEIPDSLTVAGTITTETITINEITIDGTDGTDGQVMTYDGAGNVSAEDIPEAFSLTDGNGTTANGTAVDLGGTMNDNVTIITNGNSLSFNSTSGGPVTFTDNSGAGLYFIDQQNGGAFFNMGTGAGQQSGGFFVTDGRSSTVGQYGGIFLESRDGSNGYSHLNSVGTGVEMESSDGSNSSSLIISPSSLLVTDNINSSGLQEASDYSSNYTDRHYISKGFADATYQPVGSYANISGTPTANQLATWTNATTIQGVALLYNGSAMYPAADNSVDLGILTTNDFKNGYFQGEVRAATIKAGNSTLTGTGLVNFYNNGIQFPVSSTSFWWKGHFMPSLDNTYDLGASINQIKDGYFAGTVNAGEVQVDNVVIDGATIKTDLDTSPLRIRAVDFLGAEVGGFTVVGGTGDVRPITDNSTDFGHTSSRWKDGYFAGTVNAGNITVSGTVDGRDIAADGTKLDGIEASADVTDATNVNAAGATMNNDTNVSANGWVIDEDNMASNSATKVPTQQSVKSYVDDNTGIANLVEDTTPQFGGDVDAQGNDITDVGNLIVGNPDSDTNVGTNNGLLSVGNNLTMDASNGSYLLNVGTFNEFGTTSFNAIIGNNNSITTSDTEGYSFIASSHHSDITGSGRLQTILGSNLSVISSTGDYNSIIGGVSTTISSGEHIVALGLDTETLTSTYTDHTVVDNLAILTTPGASGSTDKYLRINSSTGKVTASDIADEGVINGGNTGSNTSIEIKFIEIGDWNMDTTPSVTVDLSISGLTDSTPFVINGITIRTDVGEVGADSPLYTGGTWSRAAGEPDIILSRTTSGPFDAASHQDTSYNRGWISVSYEVPAP